MKIGILQTGRALEDLAARHGDFDAMFKTLLAGRGFEFASYPVIDDVLPDAPTECDGWLITGSRHSAYEKLQWIARLEEFLRDVYACNVPIVGICFGHQVLAQALGGTVEKFRDGWGIGPHVYDFEGIDAPVVINAWHQDQVTRLPVGASTVGRSEFCAHAAVVYENRAFTVQAHPEFQNGFMADLIARRSGQVDPVLECEARDRLKDHSPSHEIVDQIVSFFKTRKLTINRNEQSGGDTNPCGV